jgi:NADH-quinone oxidoreductase subunit M
LALYLLPILFTVLAAFAPKNVVKYVGLMGALFSLFLTFNLMKGFNPDAVYLLIDPNVTNSFGLTFKMGYDGIGMLMILLTNITILLIMLANLNRDLANQRGFNAMVMLMQFGLLGVFTAHDGIMFYMFWEITLIPIFLISYWYGGSDKKPVLIKFFIYTFIGSLAMLLSLMALGAYGHNFAYESLIALNLKPDHAFWIMGGFFLAFAIKIPLVPFHTWQPNTYTTSPMAGTMLLSALMLKMALFGIVKWMIPMAPEALMHYKSIVIVLGVIGVVYAGIIAIKQTDVKRLFAFASISHVGLIAAALMLFTYDVLTGGFVQILNHSFVAVGLFLAADVLESRLGTRDLTQMGGIAKLAPRFGFWFAVIAFASVSVPFTSGFIGEFLLIKGLYLDNWIIGVVAGTTLVFGAVYTFRAYQLAMYGSPKHTAFDDLSWNEQLTFFLLTALIVMIGVYPQYVIEMVGPSVRKLIDILQLSNTVIK